MLISQVNINLFYVTNTAISEGSVNVFRKLRRGIEGAHTAVVGVMELGEFVLLAGTTKLLTGVKQSLQFDSSHGFNGGEQIFRSFGPIRPTCNPYGSNAPF